MDCLFCRIVSGAIPSKKVFEDDQTFAFQDIDPQAPVHVLIVPKSHIASLADLPNTADHENLVGHLHTVAAEIARSQNLGRGYRTVINTGPEGGQTVSHLHLHLIGGRPMHWPPG
jgi:histidine triad (HIT) family protein